MCMVYDLTTSELLFEEPDANSVAWNTVRAAEGGVRDISSSDMGPTEWVDTDGAVDGMLGSALTCCAHFFAAF